MSNDFQDDDQFEYICSSEEYKTLNETNKKLREELQRCYQQLNEVKQEHLRVHNQNLFLKSRDQQLMKSIFSLSKGLLELQDAQFNERDHVSEQIDLIIKKKEQYLAQVLDGVVWKVAICESKLKKVQDITSRQRRFELHKSKGNRSGSCPVSLEQTRSGSEARVYQSHGFMVIQNATNDSQINEQEVSGLEQEIGMTEIIGQQQQNEVSVSKTNLRNQRNAKQFGSFFESFETQLIYEIKLEIEHMKNEKLLNESAAISSISQRFLEIKKMIDKVFQRFFREGYNWID